MEIFDSLPPPSFLSAYGAVLIGNFMGDAIDKGDWQITNVHYVSGAAAAFIIDRIFKYGNFNAPFAYYASAFMTGLAWGYQKPTKV